MISFRRWSVLATLVLLAGAALAQTPPASTSAPASQPVSDLKLTLMDGTVLTGKLSITDLSVETRFGTLKVPVTQIQSFAPGLQTHTAFQQQLTGMINDLAADAFADREKAQAALIKLGPEIRGELEKQLKGAENEKANRLQKILEEFDAQTGEDEKPRGWIKDDVVVTPGFTIVGKITTPGFAVTSSYGTLQVKMEDVREGRRDIAEEPEEIRKTIAVPGQNFATRGFTTTNIRLNRGDQVTITASGTISMQPWGSDQVSTPDGSPNYGNMGTLFGGTLVGRIGDGGTPMKIGSKASFTADRAGVLQLGIASQGSYPNSAFPGEYSVKIKVVRK